MLGRALRDGTHLQQVGETDDGRQRRAQLVRHVGQELALEARGLQDLPVLALEFKRLLAGRVDEVPLLLERACQPESLDGVLDGLGQRLRQQPRLADIVVRTGSQRRLIQADLYRGGENDDRDAQQIVLVAGQASEQFQIVGVGQSEVEHDAVR